MLGKLKKENGSLGRARTADLVINSEDTVIYGVNKIKNLNYFSAGPSGWLPRLNQRLSFPYHTTSEWAHLYLCS